MRYRLLALGWILLAIALPACAQSSKPSPDSLRQGFLNPPPDARPMMRWWWFGPAVTRPELARELKIMQQAGIGGVEIQPVYPMALDDPAKGIRNLRYLSPEFLSAVSFANRTARQLGMRVDITLGSGWPYGGPGTTLDLAAGRLRVARGPIVGANIAAPQLAPGESLIAAFAANGAPQSLDPDTAQPIDLATLAAPSGTTGRTALFFIASHTGMQVKRAAFGAEGNVLDHFSRAAIDEHLRDVAEPLLSAFGNHPPYSVFSDSLEVEGADWTPNLPEEFLKRRGYDLIPHLPELLAGGTPEADAVRHDWGKTLSELIRENYLAPITEFAEAHHTLFRSQTYGDPAVTLADEATPNLIEGEGSQWRQFSYARWATSAAHLYGRDVVSAETWTWLHSPAFRATPLDMKAEADRMFLKGVNQFVGHGWPYSPPSAGEPGWAFYAAAVFNEHNPWLPLMPEIAKYLTRVSWLLRQGKPDNDVAILLPEDDAQAAFTPGHVSVTDEMSRRISPQLMAAILDAGYNVDFIDAATIDKLGTIPYPILVIPPTDRIPLSTYKRIEQYANTGHVIAVGKTPSLAPGLKEQKDSTEIELISSRLFKSNTGHGALISSEAELPDALHHALPPDLDAAGQTAGLGFIHRKLPDRDIYFIANTSNHPIEARLGFRVKRSTIESWDPDSGRLLAFSRLSPDGRSAIPLITLAPYESRVFILSGRPNPAAPAAMQSRGDNGDPGGVGSWAKLLDDNWQIQFADDPQSLLLQQLTSWTELPSRRFYSGEATYSRTFHMGDKP
ncbi:MAG: glycosyl hydrolase, partial [Terracidiphilus sp.]